MRKALFLLAASGILSATTHSAPGVNWQPHYMGQDPNITNESTLVVYTWTFHGVPSPIHRTFLALVECDTSNSIPIPWPFTDVYVAYQQKPPLLTSNFCSLGAVMPAPGGRTTSYEWADINAWFNEHLTAQMNAPWINHESATNDFHFAVDLERWRVSGGTPFVAGQTFSFVDGLCSALPGYFAASSEISLDTSTGMFVASAPYSGDASVMGEQGVCPEPMLALIAAGFVGSRRRTN